jgi:hypothetical protein
VEKKESVIDKDAKWIWAGVPSFVLAQVYFFSFHREGASLQDFQLFFFFVFYFCF